MNSSEYEETESLLDFFYHGLRINPEAVAVRFDDGTGKVLTAAYHDIDTNSNIIASQLITLETNEEIVCVSASPNIMTMCIVVGILKAKSAFAFIDLKSNPEYNLRHLTNIGAKFVIIEENDLQEFEKSFTFTLITRLTFNDGILLLMEIVHIVRSKHYLGNCPLAYCIETSGSTGLPKLVRVSHKCIMLNVLDFWSRFKMTSSDLVFVASPFTFDPSIVDVFLALKAGAAMLLVPEKIKLMSDKLIRVLHVYNKVTILQATPSFIKRFGSNVLRNTLLSNNTSLRILGLGGERCPSKSQLRSWRHCDNETSIFNVYGITEVSSWALIHHVDFNENDCSLGTDDEIPLGDAIQGTKYELIDSEGAIVYHSGVGHIYLGGSERVCFLGWEDCSIISKEPMRPTGDLVRLENGNLFYIGRIDDQIKRNGKKISVRQIELLTAMHKAVEDCKLLYDEVKQLLILTIVLKSDHQQNPKDIIRCLQDHLSRNVPSHSAPDEIIVIETFPLTSHGKVDKRRLLQLCDMEINFPSASTFNFEMISTKLMNFWQIYLGNVVVQSSSNFILLGGNSLNSVRLSNDIQSLFLHKDLSRLVDLILNADFKTICEYIYSASEKTLPYSIQKEFDNDETASHVADQRPSDCGFISRGNVEKNLLVLSKTFDSSKMQLNILQDWKFDTGKCVDASPLIINSAGFGSVIYIGSHSHCLYAICMETGILKWCFKTNDRIESSACTDLCGKYIFFGSYDNCLYCIDANSGIKKWKFNAGNMIKSSPAYDPLLGYVYFGAYDHNTYAIQAESGDSIWKTNISNGSIFSSPLVAEDPHQIYVGTLDGYLACLCPRSGKILWKFHFDKPVFSSCRLLPQGICVGCIDNAIYYISHTGHKIWEFATEDPVFSTPCVALCNFNQGAVFCGSHDEHLHCINVEDGNLLWKKKLDSPVYGSPYFACVGESREQIVVACSTKGKLYCFNVADGRIIVEHCFVGEVFSSPVVFQDRIIVGCRDNMVYSLKMNLKYV